MKSAKSFFSLLALAFLFSANTFATSSEAPIYGEPASVTTQVQSYLNGIDVKLPDGEKKVLVDFMLNNKGEIIILSTNDKELDKTIKARLNYEKLTNHGLTAKMTYTLPLVFKNK